MLMRRAWRIIVGGAVAGLVLDAADLATRDCRLAPYVYDDCMWVGLRKLLGLPASRFLRMGVLEGVGIVLALTLYLTIQHLASGRKETPNAPHSPSASLPTMRSN